MIANKPIMNGVN